VRNLLFIFIFPAIFFTSCSTSHVSITDIEYRWPNDWYLKSTQKLYSGKVLGYRDGTRQLYYRAFFKKGRLDGPRIRWYRNGKIYIRTNYKMGIKHGPEEWWYRNGNKWGEREFDNGEVIEGSYELWKKNGEVVFDWLADEYD
jgi:antitoxin component YwqK of YwqJK toxin-antitoxin module